MLRLLGIITMFGAAMAAHAFTPDVTDDLADTALIINKSGFICSEILTMTPGLSDSTWDVRCMQFHDGTGRTHFSVDTSSGIVMKTF